jgi:hypothetical protein
MVVLTLVARGAALCLPTRVSVMRTSLGSLCTSTTLTVTELTHSVSPTATLERRNWRGTLSTWSHGLIDLVITPG